MSAFSHIRSRRDGLEVLWEDGERVFCRERRPDAQCDAASVLIMMPAAEQPTPACLNRLAHEYALKDELDAAWAVRPLALIHEHGRTMLMLEDPASEPLDRLLGAPMDLGRFLRLAIAIAAALTQLHRRGLVHKDLKPANILVNGASGQVKFTGFGIASRLPRERQAIEPSATIAGTLAYMAPEQTGRMNRSIDSRSDLYALGVTFYQMLAGALPFTANDATEWVHCHVARRPVPPSERVTDVPRVVAAIIMKLLAKTAEERYQTAAGLKSDLQHCLAAWEAQRRIDCFPLGEQDQPDRLLIPEKLYGRRREIETLLASFDRVAGSGAPELVLVSGYSGIGKSAIVHEMHKALVPLGGLFASGKFDQYKHDIPYATLAQAFQSLVRRLLAQSDAELASWRDALREALEPNGRLMLDLVPELKLIIGEQPPVPELSPRDAQRRFQLVFRRLTGVFARPDHPLVLFLDDLQWHDAATFDLLEDLLTRADLRHLLLIGAYRANEVDVTHPLMRRLAAIRHAGARVQGICLAPLHSDGVSQFIADALRCQPAHADALARLTHEKTGGNPFFMIQFLQTLAEENLLTFDHDKARWSWDLDRIQAKGYTENIVDLMVGKLGRLPAEVQTALQRLACLGSSAELTTLALVQGTSEQRVHADLREAVRLELIERLEGSYKFVHDRVQEAAYALIPEDLRAEAHLRIGRLLAAHTPPSKREKAIFEIVNQLNLGAPLIASRDEREQVAELNLIAGRRAKASTAYASALTYLAAGTDLLDEDCPARRHELAFALELNRAECEFLTGEPAAAEDRLTALSKRATNSMEQATVACLRMDVCTTLDQASRAVSIGLDYLQQLGVDWSPNPTGEDARREYDRIWSRLGDSRIEELVELPLMSDTASLATMDVLTKLLPAALFTDMNLLCLVICRAVNLSLEHGNSDGSCVAYVQLGMVAGLQFGDYNAGFRFGELGYELVERRGMTRFQAATYLIFGAHVLPWTRHFQAARDVLHRAFETANKRGDLTFAAYSRSNLNGNLLETGNPLAEVQSEAEKGLAFAQKMRFGFITDIITAQLGLFRTLRGLTAKFGCFDDGEFEELRTERHFAANPNLWRAECIYWILKLRARFFAGDYAAALEALSKLQRRRWTPLTPMEAAAYHFFGALTVAAVAGTEVAQPQHLAALAAHHRKLRLWADNCPDNFENRAALVSAEIARLEGRDIDAMQLYEQAIRSARTSGFVHNEALAYELAARFYAARGFDEFARTYLRNARNGYLRWGAMGKVRQLDERYPDIEEKAPGPGLTSTIGAAVEHLDLATVLKVSEAVSGEIVLEKLIGTLLRIAVEHAGAERGLLILPRGSELRILAEATTRGAAVTVDLRDSPISDAELPVSLVLYAARTQESVILDDASASGAFASDAYIRGNGARSVLSLPLMKQGRPVALLYLENNLTPHAFTPTRIAVLKFLASEAATSLDNARLYRELQERESRIRRLVDANVVGIHIFNKEGDIVDANHAFLKAVRYEREDLVAGRLRWTDLTPPEWRDRTARAQAEMEMTGAVQPFEKEYFRKDGSRVPVLIGSAAFDEHRNQGVAFVLDLSGRKRAEADARDSERRYREAQMELAHANRVAVMGQLTASIAHEINQPNTAVVASAQAALHWLDRQPPDLKGAHHALARIIKNANRAGEVIERIRDLIKKTPPRKDRLAINAVVREVIELTQTEAARNGVTVQTAFAERLPMVEGDGVELQQVALNLILNAIESMEEVPPGTRELSIRTAKADCDGVLVAVLDSGPGLPPANLERLFEPFYTTKARGLGIGLSICRSIIEAHGGRLWASTNMPRGAIFQFTVPAKGRDSGT
jgi:PAS domain S-box-containing protein